MSNSITFSTIGISMDTGTSINDFVTNAASQTISATLSGALDAGDVLWGSIDGGSHWTNITSKASGTSLSWSNATLLSGGNSIALKVTDVGGIDGTIATQAYTLDTTAPTNTVATATFSIDTGQYNYDLVTSNPNQEIKGTLTDNLAAGELVEVSLDGGGNWTTATVGGKGWALATPVLLTGNGTLQVRVSDEAGNPGTAWSNAYVLDVTSPTVAITSSATGTLKAGDSATLTFTFSEEPRGFTAGDLTLAGIQISGLAVTGDPKIYTASFTPLANYTGPGTVGIAAMSYTDVAGNPGAGSGVVVAANIDSQPPSAVITSNAASLKSGETALISFTFSEAPQGFTADDVVVTGGTLSTPTATGNPLVYTAMFTPTTGIQNTNASITVAAGSFTDAAGNANASAAMAPIAIDTLAPLAAATGQPIFKYDTGYSGTDLITSVASQVVSGSLSAPLAGGETVQVSFDNGANWSVATTSGTSWSLAHTLTASGVLRVRVADTAGNHSAETATAYAFDQSTPTVTITSDVATANGVTPAVITFTFSEQVVGFDSGDIVVGGGMLNTLTATANPLVYTANFNATPGVASGSATIAVGGAYQDLAGNSGAAGAIPSLQIDTVAPSATAGGINFPNDSGTGGDRITNQPLQNLSGNLSAALVAGDKVQISVDNGTNWQTLLTSIGDVSWTSTQTLSGSSTLVVRVVDAAGNFSTPYSATYTIDTAAPTATITSSATGPVGYGQSATLTITLSDPAVLTLADLVVTGGTVTAFSGSGSSYTATVKPPAGSTTPITANLGANLFSDTAGNSNTAATPFTLQVDTTLPPDPAPAPPPATTVDGVPVTTAPGPNGATVVTIPVVAPNRPDTPGTSSPLADIPLVQGSDGHPILSVSVPTGVGLTAEGLAAGSTGAAALAELGFRIERVAGSTAELINSGNVFYATLAPNESLHVQIIKPTIGAGYDGSQPLVINGSTSPADGKQAIIIDARALPSGTVIQVDNIEFIAVVGDVRLIGGAGQNMASGDGSAQWIVLGPDDDIIHGGAGNDVVGSEAGDDQVYGDAGDDTVFGGAGNDILSGGTGSDRLNGGTGFDVALQEGRRTDYTVTLDGTGIKLTHIASGVSDWLVDVEQVRFETGPLLTVAHSAAEEAAAYLFQKWLGRDLSQSEGALIQTLTGQSAEQVAGLFAQLFPTQTAGKTVAQLLDGMATEGAIRVDAVRDVVVSGDAANNTITPVLGLARAVDGGAGIDTVVLPATLAQTHIQAYGHGAFTLQRMTDGAMLDVAGVERITFNDTKLALDLNGHAGEAARLLGALAGPGVLTNKGLVGEVIRALDAGASSQTVAGLGLQLLGANTPTQIAQALWTNVVGRAGTGAEIKVLTDIMAGGTSAADLVVMAAHLDATATRIDLVGLAAKGLEFA